MSGWELPEEVEINGNAYAVNADYRNVLKAMQYLSSANEPEMVRRYVAMSLFYTEFDTLQEKDYREALERMVWFFNGGEEVVGGVGHKTIDWEQDRKIIIADINKAAGCEVRALPFCHWWTFLAWFGAIGEGQLSTVVSIREKLRTGAKMADWEKKFYRENRDKVDFRKKYTPEEDELFKSWGA